MAVSRAPGGVPGRTSRPTPAPAPAAPPAETSAPVEWLAGAIVLGTAAALFTIPLWVPGLAGSLTGPEPKVYWYLSRATGLVGFGLLWLSTASGILISNRLARRWPGAFTAYDLHEFTSLLGLGFGAIHALVLVFNGFLPYSLVDLIVPFLNPNYRPVWVGLGQLSFYLGLLVTITFYLRRRLGPRTWRTIHLLSYGLFGLALLHGLLAGTDSVSPLIQAYYWITGASIALLTVYRVVQAQAPAPAAAVTRR